jgi:hypothetical protein
MSQRELPKDLKPPEAGKPATFAPGGCIPVYETPPAFRLKPFSKEQSAKLRKSQRVLEKRARRTPEELRIANEAWFDRGPGEATP